MLLQTSNNLFHQVYPEVKFWASIVAGLWMIFKGVNWVKAIRENDLVHIQAGVDSIKTELAEQTKELVRELSELRADFRTFIAPAPIAVVRAKRRK
jgi:sulfite exporter TauE/SafE